MESNDKKNKPQSPDNEGYDINHPENLTTPSFNSTTEHRNTNTLPGVENLNQSKQSDEQILNKKSENHDISSPVNDESLTGKRVKTDLGNGQRDDDEQENEKIIRT